MDLSVVKHLEALEALALLVDLEGPADLVQMDLSVAKHLEDLEDLEDLALLGDRLVLVLLYLL